MKEGRGFPPKFPWLANKTRISDLEMFLDSLPQAALLIQPESWLIRYANTEVFELTNYTRSELTGVDARTLFADWYDPPATSLSKLGSRISPASIKKLVRRDKSQLTVRITVSPIKNQNNLDLLVIEENDIFNYPHNNTNTSAQWANLNKIFGVGVDLDLSSALEQALEGASALSGAETLCIYRFNEETPEIRKFAILGDHQSMPEVISLHDLSILNEARLWETGKAPNCSLYRHARTNNIRYVATAPIGQRSAIIGLTLIASREKAPLPDTVDITKVLASGAETIFHNHLLRRHLNADLKDKNEQILRLLTISEQVQEGIMYLTPDLLIQEINPRLEQLMGYSLKEIEGQEANNIIVGNDQVHEALKKAQEGETALTLGDIRLFRRNGELFPAMVRVFPIIDNKKVKSILVLIQDQTEKEQIRLHTEDLENRASLGTLMSYFSHEARNPINNISIALQVMASNLPADDPKQEQISRMLQDCDRLTEMIKGLLVYSKPMEYVMEPLDISQLIKRLLDRQRSGMRNQAIQCEVHIEKDCPKISGNARALEQVFTNLINNAMQAMEGMEGTISVKVSPITTNEEAHFVEVCVADSGPGIPEEIQDKIFQPFVSTKQNGHGLGLSISNRIVTAHKGKIRLTSFTGGTVFQVLFPVLEEIQ